MKCRLAFLTHCNNSLFRNLNISNMHHYLRTFHTSQPYMQTKALLAKLRKSTGYTFTNCKKALEACDNDVIKAEEWLKEQALKFGWDKAYGLAGRSALQGLVAVAVNQKSATMVEVNCETDFVAKNNLFRNFVFSVTDACFSIAKEQNQFENAIAKTFLNSAQLRNLKGSESRKLEDEAALVISQVGENILLRRAICLNVNDDLLICGCTHPTISENAFVSMGSYGSLLVYKSTSNDENDPDIPKQLCQHVIGMKPTKIGDINKDKPKENKDNETCMIYQEFLMEDETPVSQILEEKGISLVEFTRFERGEEFEEIENNIKSAS